MKSYAFVLALFVLCQSSFAAKILFLNGIPSLSHHIFNRVLVNGLAAKGHNVTFVSADISKEKTPNVHSIHLEKVYETVHTAGDKANILVFAAQGSMTSVHGYSKFASLICEGILSSNGLETLLRYPEDFKFDVIIYDFTFGSCLLPLVTRFHNPPVVAISAYANPPFTTDYVGGHKYPAYVPHSSSKYSQQMNFAQRIGNTGLYLIDWIMREIRIFRNAERMSRERFAFDFPSLKELSHRTALLLVNTDNAIDFPEPLEPNMIQVGGLQIVEPKPLPKEMEAFIKDGKKGTILMSLGTNMKSNLLGDRRLKLILETFAQLPEYNFLWKFESEADELPAKPTKNVMLSKFLPQNDILSHPNLIAFITHSGMLSTHEALWHAKPVITMPFFFDQYMNSEKAVKLGVGVKVDFKSLTLESFKTSIETVVKDPKYLESAQRVSKLFRDKPDRPLDRAIWWIEYVIRNPQVDNLVSPSLQLGPFISNSYDVLLAVAIFLYVMWQILGKVVRWLLKKWESPPSKKKNE